MARLEDDEIAADRKRTHAKLMRGVELLEARSLALILEANEMRKLAKRLEEISAAEPRDTHSGATHDAFQ